LTANWNFLWYKATPGNPASFNPAAGQELKDVSAATTITGPLLGIDIDKVDEPGEFETMGAGTYYAVATRKNTAAVAAGCPALPYRADVQDTHTNPVASLAILSNTSCLPGTDEGEIAITVTDNTPAVFGAHT